MKIPFNGNIYEMPSDIIIIIDKIPTELNNSEWIPFIAQDKNQNVEIVLGREV